MTNLNSLDEFQINAVKSEEKNLLVVASPGSGKTTVIIHRVAYLIDYKNVDPHNILIITFTKAAASEMKNRFIALSDKGVMPFFGTFHGLFYKMLKAHYNNLEIIDTVITYRIVADVLKGYMDEVSDEKTKEYINQISLFKNSGEEMSEYECNSEKVILIECLKYYEEYKTSQNLIDFDDLQLKCKELLMDNPKVLKYYESIFKYILVDEFQDCDSNQISILKLFNREANIFAVGDEDQCIYGFRGSRPDCMVEFDKHFLNSKKVYLSINYRNPVNIVDVSSKMIMNNKIRNCKKIIPSKSEQCEIKSFSFLNERKQSESVVNCIKESSNVFKFSDNVVLYRTNVESRSIIDALLKDEIPFKLLDKNYNFFNHFVCKDILAYLNLSIDSSNKKDFIRIINKPFRYISKISLEVLKNDIYKKDSFDVLYSIENIPVFQIKELRKLEKRITNLKDMVLIDAINFICDKIGYVDYLKENCNKHKTDFTEVNDVISEFKDSAANYNDIASFLGHIDDINNEIIENKDDNAVTLSTIHGVKGMEFKNVHIINCSEENIPHFKGITSNIEEERRLFYVAVTRTINNLYIYSCRNLKGKVRAPSRFIEECGLTNIINESNTYNVGDDVIHKYYGEGKILSIKDDAIEISFSKDITRRFTLDVLISNNLIGADKL